MRIRKRTPARAASPAPTAPLRSFSPPPPQQPKEERLHEEEKTSMDVAVGEQQEQVQVPAAFGKKKRAMGVPKLDPEQEPQGTGAAAAQPARCSRNDGKQWRCKGAAVPGYVFCDRHVTWSTRKCKPRPNQKNRGASLLESECSAKEPAEEVEEAASSSTTTGSTTTTEGFHGKQVKNRGARPAACTRSRAHVPLMLRSIPPNYICND